MGETLLQQIDTMRKEMIYMVEQGLSIQDRSVIEKSQALDVLIAQYLQQRDSCCKSAAEMLK